MEKSLVTQQILVLTRPQSRASDFASQLQDIARVVVVESLDEALQKLRTGSFDLVLSDSADFLPLERAGANQQSGLILETIGEGIGIADRAGDVLWANKRMREWPESVRARIAGVCREAHDIFAQQMQNSSEWHGGQGGKPAGEAPLPRARKFSFSIEDNQYFEVSCSPVVDAAQQVSQVVAICRDATSARRLQQKIDAIDQAGRELVRLEGEAIARLNVGQRLKLLEEKIIRYCRQLMHFDHFAIRLLDRTSNKLEIVICVGMPPEAIDIELFCESESNGISGWVAATGRSYICGDVARDPRYVQGLSGAKSSLTVPLMLHDKTIGIFNIESDQPAAFSEEDRQFAEIFGRYVAVALNILDLLVVERYTTSGQLAKDVTGEISGPINDIVNEAMGIIDEYIGNDDMRQRLESIIENAGKIRQSVKDVSAGTKTILGCPPAGATRKIDPLLDQKRILVADDEPTIRQTIFDLLTHCGCVVDMAEDGAQALALLAARPRYDLVLSDIKMPHKNGYEVFAAAHKLNHAPPVILMTGFGYDPNHSIVRASHEGLAAVLFKPFKVEQLMAQIKKAMGVAAE